MNSYFEMGPYSAELILPDVWHVQDATIANPAGEHHDGSFNNPSSIYVIEDDHKVLVIDAGNPHEKGALRTIVNQIAQGRVIEVAITHNHFDHVGQLADFDDCTLYLPLKDFDLTHYPNGKGIQDQDQIQLGRHTFVCIETPGHTAGSMCYYDACHHLLATGDAFGSSYVWLLFLDDVLNIYARSLEHVLGCLQEDEQVEFLCGHRYQQQIQPVKGIHPLSPKNPHMTRQYLLDMQTLVRQIQNGEATHHEFEAFGRKDDLAAYTYGQAEIDTYLAGSQPIKL